MIPVSSSFSQLDVRIREFIWQQGWEELREAQEKATPIILQAQSDLVIAAATASGKTEAAFFPALTKMLQHEGPCTVVYISPLKALINDQFGRVEQLCESLSIPVWPWHGDVSSSQKKRFMDKRNGVLLITPESLEAILCNRGTSVAGVFKNTLYFVIDELHAFIGTERGKQLQSLMHRIDVATKKVIPRIGLSATLGDISLAAKFLRPGACFPVDIVQTAAPGNGLKILIKGYEEPRVVQLVSVGRDHAEEPQAPVHIAEHLFSTLHGSNNLIFPNSRREVERYTHLLNLQCEKHGLPREFWPHHGSLAKEIRYDTEQALKQKDRPATGVCTNTLELGIDIGAVKCVAQLGPPPSVASLRQRLGRSGRRKGEPAILRGYAIEDAPDESSSCDISLRLETFKAIAMVQLLLENWFEPPQASNAHLSTLVQQILSVIAQDGGATAASLYGRLCGRKSPFEAVSVVEFKQLLAHMGEKKLLMQDSSGELLHAEVGERFVNHYSFYAAFASEEEFRLVAGGKTLGSLPVTQTLNIGQRILFAGSAWQVDDVDDAQKTIYVTRKAGGAPPMFTGTGGRIHTRVFEKVRQLYESRDVPVFLDDTVKRFVQEGRDFYAIANLKHVTLLDQGSMYLLFTWQGDAVNTALACLLRLHGLRAVPVGPAIEIDKPGVSPEEVQATLKTIATRGVPDLGLLLKDTANILREKWDWALPEDLLRKSYASQHLDLDGAISWAKTHS